MTSREYTEVAFIVAGISAGLAFHFASGDNASFSAETPASTKNVAQSAPARPAQFTSLRLAEAAGSARSGEKARARASRRRSGDQRRARKGGSRGRSAAALKPPPAPARRAPSVRTIPVSAPSTPRPAPRKAPAPSRPAPAPVKAPTPTKAGNRGTKQFDDSG